MSSWVNFPLSQIAKIVVLESSFSPQLFGHYFPRLARADRRTLALSSKHVH